MTRKSSYAFKRFLVRALLIILFFTVPFLTAGGKPVLRFDLDSLVIYVAGREFSSAYLFPALLASFSLIFLFIYMTRIFGRIWCGWACPQTILTESLPKTKNKKLKIVVHAAGALAVSVLATAGLIMYTMPPSSFLPVILAGKLHVAWYIVFTVIFLNVLLVGRVFCKTVCPYSMFQSIMFDQNTLRIGVHPERADRCIKCKACVKVCPTSIDIRDGLSPKCVSCASCVDACKKVMSKRGKKTIIDYYFGGLRFRPFGLNKVGLLAIALLFMIGAFMSIGKVGDVTVKTVSVNITDGGYKVDLLLYNSYSAPVEAVFGTVTENGVTVKAEKRSYSVGAKNSATARITLTGTGAGMVNLEMSVFQDRSEYKRTVTIKLPDSVK